MMAIRIELWTDGHLADGTEAWWDGMEAALTNDTSAEYPLLDRVDPYNDVVFVHGELDGLASELRTIMVHAHEGVQALVLKLIELCLAGTTARDAQLKFFGD